MSEIIAVKKSGIGFVYGFCLVFGILMLIGAIALVAIALFGRVRTPLMIFQPLIFVGGGVAILVVGATGISKYCRTPSTIIEYNNGTLIFPNFSCPVSNIVNVQYKEAASRYRRAKWGKLTVILTTGTATFDYVADVENVHNRLIYLMRQSSKMD